MVIIRLDANTHIGSGHFMRCLGIAGELQAMGEPVLFAVSDVVSAAFAGARGAKTCVIEGNYARLSATDGAALGHAARDYSAHAVLIDSYAIDDTFIRSLRLSAPANCRIALVDDCYSLSMGFLDEPQCWDVDCVINYGFGFSRDVYRSVYEGKQTQLLLGPAYAPIRQEFRSRCYSVNGTVKTITVTTGSTNPDHALERMVEGVQLFGKAERVRVVVGPQASFDEAACAGLPCELLHNVSDMASLMVDADVALSAAGSTLYELCCVGVPTIALPVVENQMGNVRGFAGGGFGVAANGTDWTSNDVARLLDSIDPYEARLQYSSWMRKSVDGCGASRIAAALMAQGTRR